jgi:hypothetical protein
MKRLRGTRAGFIPTKGPALPVGAWLRRPDNRRASKIQPGGCYNPVIRVFSGSAESLKIEKDTPDTQVFREGRARRYL